MLTRLLFGAPLIRPLLWCNRTVPPQNLQYCQTLQLKICIIPNVFRIIKWLRYRDDTLLRYNGTNEELSDILVSLKEAHEHSMPIMEAFNTEVTSQYF